jgi:hypothetical protein
MDFYEQLIQIYLTVEEGSFVLPQAKIAPNENWQAYPDFLAVNFIRRQIQVIEVSKTTKLKDIRKLAEKLGSKHREIIEKTINDKMIKELNFPIHWRFFVRDEEIAKRLEENPFFRQYLKEGGHAEAISLKNVFNRIRDLMP